MGLTGEWGSGRGTAWANELASFLMVFEKFLSGSVELDYLCWQRTNLKRFGSASGVRLMPSLMSAIRQSSTSQPRQMRPSWVCTTSHCTNCLFLCIGLCHVLYLSPHQWKMQEIPHEVVSTSCLPNKPLFLTQCSPLQGFKFKKCSAWSFARVWQTQKPRCAGCFQITLGMSCDQNQIPSSSV